MGTGLGEGLAGRTGRAEPEASRETRDASLTQGAGADSAGKKMDSDANRGVSKAKAERRVAC